MPDIDPAALTRSDSFSQPLLPPVSVVKQNGATASTSQKASKSLNTAQRIDLEPLYTSLKSAIGDHWGDYKDGISLFVLGHLNQNELSFKIDYFVKPDPMIEHLHNQLVSAIYANIQRDLPDAGIAPWVSANDKPAILSKSVSGDAAEQRLKTEVMQLPARDRRRLKEVVDVDHSDSFLNTMSEYHLAKQVKVPDSVPVSAGGSHKTNWDLEIRKRYSQPLASETGEFPDAEAIHGRMVPICYEESLVNGCAPSCAEFMATATEQFIKEVLSSVYSRTRSNVPSSSGNGIMTHKYRRQLEREEEALLRGDMFRGPGNGLLPVEVKEALGRRPLGMTDLRLALEVGDCGLGQMPEVVQRVMSGYVEGELEDYRQEQEEEEEARRLSMENRRVNGGGEMNGINGVNGFHGEEPSIDESDWGWEGGGAAAAAVADREELNSWLDECLAIGQ